MPVAFAEVYMALQQGMADGQENPVPTIQAMGFHEVQEYLNLTGHIQSSIQILVNDQVWQRLNADQQHALERSVWELGKQVYEGTLRDEREILSRWRDEEVLQVIEDVDREAFRSRAREYFATGFPFSRLYQAISAWEPLPQSELAAEEQDQQRTSAQRKGTP
jgi:TRAP-type C4-dicarboxylate transport system substrate-binding protein